MKWGSSWGTCYILVRGDGIYTSTLSLRNTRHWFCRVRLEWKIGFDRRMFLSVWRWEDILSTCRSRAVQQTEWCTSESPGKLLKNNTWKFVYDSHCFEGCPHHVQWVLLFSDHRTVSSVWMMGAKQWEFPHDVVASVLPFTFSILLNFRKLDYRK